MRLLVPLFVMAALATMAPPGGHDNATIRRDEAARDTVWIRHEVRVGASEIYVLTHRKGLFSFLGHEHALVPMDWTGEACVSDPLAPGAWGSLLLQTSSLLVDSDSARSLAGLGEGPGEEDREKIQRKLLDEDHLSAQAHPTIQLRSVVLGMKDEDGTRVSRVRVRTRLTLRGETREVLHPARVEERPDGGLLISGTLEVRQSRFGIEPESILGVVKVADPVELHFRLVTRPTGSRCPPDSLESFGGGSPRAAPSPAHGSEAPARNRSGFPL